MAPSASVSEVSVLFSEPKIPQYLRSAPGCCRLTSFSALQRAENSSIVENVGHRRSVKKFQCSSASRKFLNPGERQRTSQPRSVSVLFSEPKIPQSSVPVTRTRAITRFSALQRAENSSMSASAKMMSRALRVSVLFSEPKIPQFTGCAASLPARATVSVLFSEPKIPQFRGTHTSARRVPVSVLFSEPKIPQ